MGPMLLRSQRRKPLQETDTNSREGSFRSATRGWWPLKTFSVERPVETESKLQVADDKNRFEHAVAIVTYSQVPLAAVLAQVGGGPLRAVHLVQKSPQKVLLLEFLDKCDAQVYRNYVLNKKCYVNGILVTLASISDQWIAMLKPLNLPALPDLARRTLEIYRPVTSSYERPQLMHCDVNPVYVKETFSKIGLVLQVRPMIYQKYIAFAIDFANVESAIEAKRCFDEEALLNRSPRSSTYRGTRFPGLHGWALDFSQDGTERNCFF